MAADMNEAMPLGRSHSLKLHAVVESVEAEKQLSLSRLLNCDEMHVCLFSKAVPAEIFETSFLTPRGASDAGADGISAPAGSLNWPRTMDTVR
jgi:hypothetical protein